MDLVAERIQKPDIPTSFYQCLHEILSYVVTIFCQFLLNKTTNILDAYF